MPTPQKPQEQHLCHNCAYEISPDYKEFVDKIELSARGELLCDICHARPAQAGLQIVGNQSGFWCRECARRRPWPTEMRQAVADEALRVGLTEEQLRSGLEELGDRLRRGDPPLSRDPDS